MHDFNQWVRPQAKAKYGQREQRKEQELAFEMSFNTRTLSLAMSP